MDKFTGIIVAIKEISKRGTSWKRFLKELDYGRKLAGHPNIITTHSEAYKTKSAYLLVQDYADGGDLCSVVVSQGKIKEETCKSYFFQICSAVKHMHDLNLVHLDLKPDNILLKDSTVKLADFGLAERIGKKLKGACGSLSYMAPETFDTNGLPVAALTARSSLDMWSLGVLLFSMLVGLYPWMQASLKDPDFSGFCRWQVGATHSCPVEWQHITPELSQLLQSLFAVNPQHRCRVQEVFNYMYFDKKWLKSH
jgi:serine/threonine protein kinase